MPLTILNLYWNFHTFLRLEKKYKNSLTFTVAKMLAASFLLLPILSKKGEQFFNEINKNYLQTKKYIVK